MESELQQSILLETYRRGVRRSFSPVLQPGEIRKPYKPSPAEIRTACAAIRRTWSAAEKKRRNQYARVPYTIPCLSVGTLLCDYCEQDGNL